MKIILFDLGNTLEDTIHGGLVAGARETLEAIQSMRDADGNAPVLALVSDFGELSATPEQVSNTQREYYEILRGLGIDRFFEPLMQRVTLSTEAGAEKPSPIIFQAAIDKAGASLGFQDALFITEKKPHVLGARQLGIKAIHFKGPGETEGEVDRLLDLVPPVRDFCGAIQPGDN